MSIFLNQNNLVPDQSGIDVRSNKFGTDLNLKGFEKVKGLIGLT